MGVNIDWKSKLNHMAPKRQQLLIMLLVGVLLVIIAMPAKKTEEKSAETAGAKNDRNSHVTDYVAGMEEKLGNALQHVAGVGKAEVMITLKSTAEKVIEKDSEHTSQQVEESDKGGGERTTLDASSRETTIYNGTNENQTPYVKKEMTPEIEGIIVIAEGGGNPATIQNITEAVQALFNVDTHKIKIMKMNQRK